MALKITSSGLITRNYLQIQSDGVIFMEATAFSSKRRFRFSEITCILMSQNNKLSFQVGDKVFSIAVKPDNEKHQKVIATFVSEVKRAGTGWAVPSS